MIFPFWTLLCLLVAKSSSAAVANTACSDATPIALGLPTNATHLGRNTTKWYSVVLPAETEQGPSFAVLRASTCLGETDFDTLLEVYSSCDDNVSPIVVNDDLKCYGDGEFHGRYRCYGENNERCKPDLFVVELYTSTVRWNVSSSSSSGSVEQQVYYYIAVKAGNSWEGSEKEGTFRLQVDAIETPINNVCKNATLLDLSSNSTTVRGQTDAAKSDNDFANKCFPEEAVEEYRPGTIGPSIFYRLIGNGQTIRVSTCFPYTNFETILVVLEGSDCSNLQCLTQWGDVFGSECGWPLLQGNAVTFDSVNATTYFILVSGFSISARMGNFELGWETFDPIPNDSCNSSSPIEFESVTHGSTLAAKDQPDDVPFCIETDGIFWGAGVWYMIEGKDNYTMTVSTQADNLTHQDEWVVYSVYTGDHCDALQCISGREDGAPMNFHLASNQTYYIMVFGHTKVDEFNLSVTGFVPSKNDLCAGAVGPLLSDGSITSGSLNLATHQFYQYHNIPWCPTTSEAAIYGQIHSLPKRGLWYYLDGTGENTKIAFCNEDGAQVSNRTFIQVFYNACDSLTCIENITYDEDPEQPVFRGVEFPSIEGERYFVNVFGQHDEEFGICVMTASSGSIPLPSSFSRKSIWWSLTMTMVALTIDAR